MEPGTRPEPWEIFVATLLGALVSVAIALLLTAGIAGMLFGDGWASGELADMPASSRVFAPAARRLPLALGHN